MQRFDLEWARGVIAGTGIPRERKIQRIKVLQSACNRELPLKELKDLADQLGAEEITRDIPNVSEQLAAEERMTTQDVEANWAAEVDMTADCLSPARHEPADGPRQRPAFGLATLQSTGPRVVPQSDGSVHVKSTPCLVCDQPIGADQWISRVRGRWAHRQCAQGAVNTSSVRAAWLTLGEDLARQPRAYGVKETRAIVEHLVDMAHRAELEEGNHG